MKRKLAMLLCGCLAVSMVAGCGGGNAGGEGEKGQETASDGLPAAVTEATAKEPGWMADTEPVTLDWYVNYSWYSSMWDTGEFS